MTEVRPSQLSLFGKKPQQKYPPCVLCGGEQAGARVDSALCGGTVHVKCVAEVEKMLRIHGLNKVYHSIHGVWLGVE